MPEQKPPDDETDRRRHGERQRDGAPHGEPGDVDQGHGDGEGPRAEKHGVPEREQARIAEQEVVADGIEGKHDDLRQHVQVVLLEHERHHGPEGEEDGDEEIGCVFLCHHCFSPKSPEGLTIRTAAMSR